MKVIYVSYMRLSDKASRDWYINFLQSKNVEVEYWDLVPLLFGGDLAGSKKTEYLRVPRTYQELRSMISCPNNKGASFVMVVTYEGRTVKLYRLLSKHGCRMFFIAWGAMPIKQIQALNKLSNGITNPLQLVRKAYYKVKAIAYRKWKLIKPFEVVFAAGHAVMVSEFYAKHVIPINLMDYDHYRKTLLERERIVAGRYAVFLDINLPYQSDLKIVGMQAVNPRDYYASLNQFFDIVELKYGLQVVIAAHPKADYSAELFNGREIYHSQTALLVKDADWVISHHSTSVSYAVLNQKPIIFIYTNEMALVYENTVVKYLRDYAAYLDAAIYNIDKITQSDQIMVNDVNVERYDKYKYSYITTHESENSLTQDIFWREICENQFIVGQHGN